MREIDEVVAHAETVWGYMHSTELRWLAELARDFGQPTNWCEIGCWQGRSATATVGGLHAGSTLTLVDNFSGPTTRESPDPRGEGEAARRYIKQCTRRILAEMERMRAWAPGVDVEFIFGLSPEVAPQVAGASLDVLFVDGDHKYAAVVADILAWLPKMKRGALMCGHDFTNKVGVEPAVRELLPQFEQVAGTSLWYARL